MIQSAGTRARRESTAKKEKNWMQTVKMIQTNGKMQSNELSALARESKRDGMNSKII